MRRALGGIVLTAATTLFAGTPARAVPTTFAFTGVITAVEPELATQFAVNESVTGSYTFESTTPENPAEEYHDAVIQLSATFGGDYTITQSSTNDIFVINQTSVDAYDVFAENVTGPAPVAGYLPILFVIILNDTNSTVFSASTLPLTPPSLSAFDLDFSGVTFAGTGGNASIDFRLTSLTLQSVPEAGGAVMGAAASMGFAAAVTVGRWLRGSAGRQADGVCDSPGLA